MPKIKYIFILIIHIAFLLALGIWFFQNYNLNSFSLIKRRSKSKFPKSDAALEEISADIFESNSQLFPQITGVNADQYLSHVRDLIYRFRVTPNPSWEYLSPSVYDITGFSREEHYNDSSIVFNTIHPEDRQILIDKISNRVDYSKPLLQRWYKKDGSLIWLEEYCSPIYDAKGNLIAFEGVCRDITEKVLLDNDRNNSIISDPLTGLCNRAYFEKTLSKIKENEPIGIIVIGIDGLRNINYRSGGYETGNRMIVTLADILKNSYIENSILARTGSAEFSVLLRDLSINTPEAVSRSILKLVLDCNVCSSETILHTSIGFSSTNKLKPKALDVFLDADKNMHNNKAKKYKA